MTLKTRHYFHTCSPSDICERATKSNSNDESGDQEQCHSILQILLRCNEPLRATCSLLPLKPGPTSSIFRAAEVKLTVLSEGAPLC